MQLIASDPRHRHNWPVFLVGCHRSGTTLLRYILDAHPRLACPPESKFIAGLQAFISYPQVMTALRSLGVSDEATLGLLKEVIDKVLGGYASRRRKPRWIDKTPNYYKVLSLIDAIYSQQVLYLFVVRHPLDCICSMEEAPYFQPGRIDDPDVAGAMLRHGYGRGGFARYWVEVNSTILSFLPAGKGRALIVRYEDLVQAPEAIVREMLAFIDEDYIASLLESVFVADHSEGLQDWKIRQTTAIHRTSVGRFREWPHGDATTTWEVVRGIADVLGYELAAPFTRAFDSESLLT